jgi:hypothetical protein
VPRQSASPGDNGGNSVKTSQRLRVVHQACGRFCFSSFRYVAFRIFFAGQLLDVIHRHTSRIQAMGSDSQILIQQSSRQTDRNPLTTPYLNVTRFSFYLQTHSVNPWCCKHHREIEHVIKTYFQRKPCLIFWFISRPLNGDLSFEDSIYAWMKAWLLFVKGGWGGGNWGCLRTNC